jgi:hypothetical protein
LFNRLGCAHAFLLNLIQRFLIDIESDHFMFMLVHIQAQVEAHLTKTN